MKILHVIDKMDPKLGGVSQAVRTMVSGLTDLYHNNEVLSLDDPASSFIADKSVVIHSIGPGKTSWSYSPILSSWLSENLLRFDVIIVHGLWLYHSYALTRAMRKLKSRQVQQKGKLPKLFVMPHGMLDPYFQKAKGRRLKALRNNIYWKLIEKNVVNNADGLLFTCEEERTLARLPFSFYHPKKEIVVGLGVEEPPVYTTAMNEAFLQRCPEVSTSPYLLFIGRIDQKKGIDLLIQAYHEVFRSVNSNKSKLATVISGSREERFSDEEDITPKLVIAGPGLETLYGQATKNMVAERELNGRVIFPGMLTGDAKWGAFYGCDAFVLPSHQENFGIAVAEALACKKPVLISNKINIHHEIQSGCCGLVSSDTLDGVKEILMSWKTFSSEKKRDMAVNAREVYTSKFAVAPVAKRMEHCLLKY